MKMTSPLASTAYVGMEVRDLEDPYAVEIIKVYPGSTAEAAGVQAGDRVKASSYTFFGARGLQTVLVQMRGDWFTINITRDGKRTVPGPHGPKRTGVLKRPGPHGLRAQAPAPQVATAGAPPAPRLRLSMLVIPSRRPSQP